MHILDGNVKQNKFPDIDLMSDLFIKQRENSSQYLITFADQQYYPEIIIGNCVFPSGIESISLSEFSQAKPVSIPTIGTNAVLSTGANDVSIIVTLIYNSTFALPLPKPYVVYSPTNSLIGLLADLHSLLLLCKLFPIVPVYSYQLKSLINLADIDRLNTLLYPKDNVTFCAIETVLIEYIKELPGSVRVTLQLLPTLLNKTTEYDFMTVKYKDGLGVKELFFTSGEIYTEVVNHRNKSIPKELQTIYSDLQSHRITLEMDKDFVLKSIYYNLVTDLLLIFDVNQYNPQNVTFDNISKTVNDLSTKLQTTSQLALLLAGGTTKLVNIIAKYNKEIEDVKSALANISKIVIDSNELDVSVISLTLSYRHVFLVQLSSNNIIPYRQYMGTTGWEGNIVISADVDPVNELKTVSLTSIVNEIIGIKLYTEQLVRNHKDQIPAVPLKIGGMTSLFGLNLLYITNIDVKNIDNSNSAIVVNIPFIGIDNINFVSFLENVLSNRSLLYSFIDKLYSKEGLNSNELLINNIYNNIAEVDKKTHTLKQDIITNLKLKAKDLIKLFKPFDGLVDKLIEKIADNAVNLEISNILASSILIYIPLFTYGLIGLFLEGILDYDTYISGINNTDYKLLKTIDNNSLVSKNKNNTFTNYGKRELLAIMPLLNPNQLPSEIFLNTTTYILRYIVKTLYSSELDDTYYDQVIAILLTSLSGNDLFYRTTPTMLLLGDAKTTTANMQDDVANVGTYLALLKTYALLNPSTKVNINSETFIGKFLSLFLYTPSKNLMNTLATSQNTYYAAYGVWDLNYVANNPIFSLETVLQPYTGLEDDKQYKTRVFFKINKSNNVKYLLRIREIIDNYTFKYNNTFISTMASLLLAYIFSERMPSTLGVLIDAMFVTDSENIYDIMTKFSTISKYNMFDWITKDSSAPMKYAFTWENVEGTELRRKYVQEQLNIMLVSMAFVNLFYDMPGTVINMLQLALSSNESIIEKLFKTISSWLWPFVLVKNAIIELLDNNFDITKGSYSLENIINIENINTDALLFYDFYNKFKTFLPEPVLIMLLELYYQIISKLYDASNNKLNLSKIIVDLYEPGKNNGQPQVLMKNYFNAIVYLNRYIANFILGTKTNYLLYYEMMKYNTLMTMNMDQLIETIMLIEDKLASMIENELVLAGVADIDIGGYPLIDFEQYYRIQWADEIEYSMTSFAEQTLERTKQYLFKVYLEQLKIMYNRNINNDTGEPINDTLSTSYVESAYTAIEYTSAKDQEDLNTLYKLIARYLSNDLDSRLIKNLNVLALMSTLFSGFDITNKDLLNLTTDENDKPIKKLEYKQVGIDSQTKLPVEILTTKDLSLSDYYEKTRESIKSLSLLQISRLIILLINPGTVTMTNALLASNGLVNYTTPVSNAILQIDYALLSSNTLNNIEYNIRLSQGNNSIDKQNEIISSLYNMNQLLLGNYKLDINLTADILLKTQELLSQVVQYSPNRIVFNTMQLSELYLSLYYALQLDAGYATKLQLSPKLLLVLILDNGRYKSGYTYGLVLDVQVSRELDNPVDVLTIVIPGPNVMTSLPDLNMYEVLSYKVVYNQPLWLPVFSMLQPGQDIEIRIGYTKKVNKMGKVFAGYIRDTQYNQDGTITIVAEGYGSVLARPVFEKSDHINQFFLDPRLLIVKLLSKVGSYKLGYVATSSIIESILLKSDDLWLFALDDKKYLAAVSYQPFAENLYYPTDYWTGLRSGLGSQLYFANFEMHFANYTIQPGSSAWDVIDDLLSMLPDFILQVEPIEELGQARVFFGKPTWPFKFLKVSDYIGSKADVYINSQLAIIIQANRNILKMSDPNFVANESNDLLNPDNLAGTVWTPTNSPQNSKTVKYINYKTHSQSALNSLNDIELLLICLEMNLLLVAGINRKSQLSAAINNLNQKLQALTNDVNKVYKPLIDDINDISYIYAETKVILSALKEMLTFITDTKWHDTVIDFVATVDSTVNEKKYTTIYGFKLSDTNSFKWPTSENTWFYNPLVLSVITSVSNLILLANQKKLLERLYSILEVNSTKYGYWLRKGYQIRSVFNWNLLYTVTLSDFNPFRRSGRETLSDLIIEGPNKKFKQAEIDRALNYITPIYYSLQELLDTSPKTSKNKMPLHKTGKLLLALTLYLLDILGKQSTPIAYGTENLLTWLMITMFNDFLNKGLRDKNNVEQSIGSINLMLNYINKTVYYTDLKIKEFKKELSNVFAYTILELLRFDINPMSMKRLSDGAEFKLQSVTGLSINELITVLRILVQNANKYYNCKSPAGENAADQSVVNIAQDIENIAIKYLGPSGFIIQHKNGSKIKYANNSEATITELYNLHDTGTGNIAERLIGDLIRTLVIDKSDQLIEYIYSKLLLLYQPNIKLDFRESGLTIPNMKDVNNNFVLQHLLKQITSLKDLLLNIFKMLNAAMTISGSSNDPLVVEQQKAINTAINTLIDEIAGTIDVFISKYYDIATAILNNNKNVDTIKNTLFGLFEKLLDLPNKIMIFVDKYKQAYSMMIGQALYIGDTMEKATEDSKPMNLEECINYITSMYYLLTLVSLLAELFMILTFDYRKSDIMNLIVENIKDIAGFKADHQITIDDISLLLLNNLNDILTDIESVSSNINTRLITIKTDLGTNTSKYGVTSSAPKQTVSSTNNVTADNRSSQQTTTTKNEPSKEQQFALYNQQYQDTLTELQNNTSNITSKISANSSILYNLKNFEELFNLLLTLYKRDHMIDTTRGLFNLLFFDATDNKRGLLADKAKLYPVGTKPFADYHIIDDRIIIKNTISLNYNMANKIILYSPTYMQSINFITPVTKLFESLFTVISNDYEVINGQHMLVTELIFDEDIPNEYTKALTVTTNYGNIPQTRILIAAYHLKKSLETMYSGQLIIVGKPNIKPYDYIQILDSYNMIVGMLQVSSVMHIMSLETGYITLLGVMPIVETRDLHYDSLGYTLFQIFNYAAGIALLGGNNLFLAAGHTIGLLKTGTKGLSAAGQSLLKFAKKIGSKTSRKVMFLKVVTKHMLTGQLIYNLMDYLFLPGNEAGDEKLTITVDKVYNPVSIKILQKNGYMFAPNLMGSYLDNINVFHEQTKNFQYTWNNVVLQTNDIFYSINSFGFTDLIKQGVANQLISDL